jgi:hypothetical protein
MVALLALSKIFAGPAEMAVKLRFSVVRVLCGNAIPLVPENSILALQESRDEFVLRAEVAMEAGFGDASSLNNEVDADSSAPRL